MAEVTLRWPTVRSNPLHPEWEERTYSGTQAAAEAVVQMGHDVWVHGMRVTVADAQRELGIRAQCKAEQTELAKSVLAERDRVIADRLTAVQRVVVRQQYAVPLAEADRLLAKFPVLAAVAREKAQQIIAAYTAVC